MKRLLLLTLLCCTPLHPLIILVHGTFRDPYYIIQRWINPNGEFYKQIEQQARAIDHETYVYKWSGHNNNNARIEAAFGLAELLLTTPGDNHILIGHSHGGNVIALASEIIALLETNRDAEKIAEIISSRMATTTGPLFEKSTFSLKRTKKKIKKLTEKALKIPSQNRTNKIIETAFLEGTPVCEWYQPSSKTINKVISLYSFGDNIQLLVGKRKFPETPHIVNIRVILNGTNPSHRSLSSPVIAKWLLSLRTAKLKNNMIARFSKDQALELIDNSQDQDLPWYRKLQKKLEKLFFKKTIEPIT